MRKGTCKYHTGWVSSWSDTPGPDGKTPGHECKLGIRYDSVVSEPERLLGRALRLPCHNLPIFHQPHQVEEHMNRGKCDRYTEPTDEEIAAFEAESKRMVEMHLKVLPLVMEVKQDLEGSESDCAVSRTCPICGKTLTMAYAAVNGHVHGQCETKGCVSWME